MKFLWLPRALIHLRNRNSQIPKYVSFCSKALKQNDAVKSCKETDVEKESFWSNFMIANEFFTAFKETAYNIKEEIGRGPQLVAYPNEVDIITRFTGDPKELEKWHVTTDNDFAIGHSTAHLDITPDSKGLFHGFLDTRVPLDGVHKASGVCNLRLAPPTTPLLKEITYDWEAYNYLVVHVRGDGRNYMINLHLKPGNGSSLGEMYHYFIWTRGGPYWQHVRIPFSKFIHSYQGRVQPAFPEFDPKSIYGISITIADKITGPFRLEIDYIGVEWDPSREEKTVYETYRSNIIFN